MGGLYERQGVIWERFGKHLGGVCQSRARKTKTCFIKGYIKVKCWINNS